MEYEVNSKPFDEHDLVDDVIEADSAFEAALKFARTDGPAEAYVRELGSTGEPVRFVFDRRFIRSLDVKLIEAVAWRLRQAAFFAQCPSPAAHVLAKSWLTQAFYHGGKIDDFETRVRAVQLLIHFDTFVADCIKERDHARN